MEPKYPGPGGRVRAPFQEAVYLARRLSRTYGRTIAVFPETKHSTYFRSMQPFEPTSLRRMTDLGVPLWQALGTTGGPYYLIPSGDPTAYKDMMTPAGPARIAAYADWIGFRAENQFLPADLRRGSGADDFGDAFAEYALYYWLGVDAVVSARGGAAVRCSPDLAVKARRGA